MCEKIHYQFMVFYLVMRSNPLHTTVNVVKLQASHSILVTNTSITIITKVVPYMYKSSHLHMYICGARTEGKGEGLNTEAAKIYCCMTTANRRYLFRRCITSEEGGSPPLPAKAIVINENWNASLSRHLFAIDSVNTQRTALS